MPTRRGGQRVTACATRATFPNAAHGALTVRACAAQFVETVSQLARLGISECQREAGELVLLAVGESHGGKIASVGARRRSSDTSARWPAQSRLLWRLVPQLEGVRASRPGQSEPPATGGGQVDDRWARSVLYQSCDRPTHGLNADHSLCVYPQGCWVRRHAAGNPEDLVVSARRRR